MSESRVVEKIIESQKKFVGEETALTAARKAPLEIDSDGNVKNFYGTEETVVEILLQQIFNQTGRAGVNYSQNYLIKQDLQIPKGVETPEREESVIEAILKNIKSLVPV